MRSKRAAVIPQRSEILVALRLWPVYRWASAPACPPVAEVSLVSIFAKENVRTLPNPIPLAGLEQVRTAFHKTVRPPVGTALNRCGSMAHALRGRAGSVL